MLYCVIYSVVLENHSVLNSHGEGVYKQLTVYYLLLSTCTFLTQEDMKSLF